MVGKELHSNLNLALKINSELNKPLNFYLRKEATKTDSLDKLWARRTSLSGKKSGVVSRLRSDRRISL